MGLFLPIFTGSDWDGSFDIRSRGMAKKTQESMAAQLRVARAEIERLRSRLDQQSQTAEAMYASLREWKRQISEFYANLS